jgi:hypothetical protein
VSEASALASLIETERERSKGHGSKVSLPRSVADVIVIAAYARSSEKTLTLAFKLDDVPLLGSAAKNMHACMLGWQLCQIVKAARIPEDEHEQPGGH